MAVLIGTILLSRIIVETVMPNANNLQFNVSTSMAVLQSELPNE